MKVEEFIKIIDADFYTGVPDSQLKPICNYLMACYGIDSKHHIIAANEGNCAAIAAGYYLATGKVPVVYLQNSGEGNILNPVTSLLHQKVYAIPELFIIGWRGEPGIPDEPQHIFQGEITRTLLDELEIASFVVTSETSGEEMTMIMKDFQGLFAQGRSTAFIVKKNAVTYDGKIIYKNSYKLKREEIIQKIVEAAEEDIIISTTGKASRELFEIRTRNGQEHNHDFLTVGSMGHTSSIALGVAIQKPHKRIWCIDGDGAALMHMGAMAVLGAHKPENMIHIIINNESHETVGGMPTVAGSIGFVGIAKACGYENVFCVSDWDNLNEALVYVKEQKGLSLIEIKCAIGAREDLGRPTTTAAENKKNFMEYLSKKDE